MEYLAVGLILFALWMIAVNTSEAANSISKVSDQLQECIDILKDKENTNDTN